MIYFLAIHFELSTELNLCGDLKLKCNHLFFPCNLQAVTNLLNNESVSDIDRLRLVMLYALRYEKESPVQLMQLFTKLSSKNAKYKPGVINGCCCNHCLDPLTLCFVSFIFFFFSRKGCYISVISNNQLFLELIT